MHCSLSDSYKMLFLSVLCLAVGALSHPTLFLPHDTLESGLYYPSLTIVEADEKPVPGIPLAPKLEPLPLGKALDVKMLEEDDIKPEEIKVLEEILEEEKEEKEEESREETEERKKEIELEMEKHTDEEKPEDPKKPVVVQLEVPHIPNIPEVISNWWTNRPFQLPHINFPQINLPFGLSNIFSKPPATAVPAVETAKLRISYDLPSYYINDPRYRIIVKK